MDRLGRRYDLSQVFNDLLTMSICGFHRTNIQTRLQEKDEVNENLYMQTIKKYTKEDLEVFAELLGILQLNVLDNPYSDLLGEYFMNHISKGQNGQYFTPDPVCEFMALVQGQPKELKHKRVLDPACGSGRMLLSFAKNNPENYFFGADNNHTCAQMCVVNFFLNGLKGEVAWMNSLTMEFYGAWHINTNGLGILPIEKEQSTIWNAPAQYEKIPLEFSATPAGNNPADQLTLF